MAKTRIMLATNTGEKIPNPVFIITSVYRQNGMGGVFAGFVPRVMWITLGGAIFFGSYDLSTKVVKRYLE